MIEKSKNQWSANIIALSFFDKALDKALDKAFVKHVSKHPQSTCESTQQSIDSIVKQITNNQLTSLQINKLKKSIDSFLGDKPKRFTPPLKSEIEAYCFERKNKVDAQRFLDHYTSNGWMVGKTKMKDWKASVRTWEKNNQGSSAKKQEPNKSEEPKDYSQTSF
jgi:hypothetical protein